MRHPGQSIPSMPTKHFDLLSLLPRPSRSAQHPLGDGLHLDILDALGDLRLLLVKHARDDLQYVLQLALLEPGAGLLDDKQKRDHRTRARVIDLQVLGLVEAVLGGQGAEQRVRALVEGHGAVGVLLLGGDGAVVRVGEVGQGLVADMG